MNSICPSDQAIAPLLANLPNLFYVHICQAHLLSELLPNDEFQVPLLRDDPELPRSCFEAKFSPTCKNLSLEWNSSHHFSFLHLQFWSECLRSSVSLVMAIAALLCRYLLHPGSCSFAWFCSGKIHPSWQPVPQLASASPAANQQSKLCEPLRVTAHCVPVNPINKLTAEQANSWPVNDSGWEAG